MTSFSVAVRELPLFPLPELVLFPSRPLPLHVFEFRYRIMMNTILENDRRFGVLMVNPADGSIADGGCCAEVVHCEKLPDGRMKMLTVGQQRFRVLDYVREKPYRVGLVEWLEDDFDGGYSMCIWTCSLLTTPFRIFCCCRVAMIFYFSRCRLGDRILIILGFSNYAE